ncbi:Stk1 family PASTA domain-containing Ser/Thr kinase [uncultured Oscillibacter sp.]|uniref:Stk1 family PASTA domain-containing Ser/Thr kinase n=1 Tax=uncultured Oscillibacter sp. TaxID=876091 RepID=UPI0025E81A46|nr:Stk1 family PASTA domain-containing Ser/Thr kinase [uncultured Oscillibacter sp.]
MDQYIGKMLDNRYEILERIGTGGMAVVYKAKCHRLNRLVAIKILKSDLAQNEDFRRRFNAESQAVAQLSHPNIVSVYDVSRGGDIEYIVMELIDGITLKQYMEKRGQLNWRESLHFITQIMRGLSHAHSRGIIHRDIKPQNVMVLRDGSVKVADFGIACLENSAQTLTQEALGSVHYISPEQARGDRTDARSDVYSAGVVLYEMLTGRLPFEGDSAVSVAIQHLSSIPLAPREINPDIPPQLELICMKAMAPELDKRYPSADAMIADLEAFRKNPGVSLDFELEDLRPTEEDEPTRPLRTGSVHAAMEANHTAHRSHSREAERYQDYDEPSPPNRKRTAVIVGAVVVALVLVAVLFKVIFSSFGTSTPDDYEVPNLLGKTMEQALAMPEIDGIFTVTETATEYSDEYDEGEIMRQTPSAGEVRRGDNLKIEVTISLGENTGEMIDVVNQEAQAAILALKTLSRENNLDLIIDASVEYQEFSDEISDGYVIRTDPAEGATLKKGDTIKVYVSKGPELERFPVPPFVGQNIDKVREQLKTTWKLTCTDADIETVDSDRPAGEIVWQSIESGTEVTEGSTIKFKVSSGLAPSQTRTISVVLPQDGRESVDVWVTVDGEEQYNNRVSCSQGSVSVSLTGYGTQHVQVYIDGEEDPAQAQDLQFD